jgi:hypothetical protein
MEDFVCPSIDEMLEVIDKSGKILNPQMSLEGIRQAYLLALTMSD